MLTYPPKMKVLTLCFLAILASLILQVFLSVKDINDAWILEGLFPFFILFVVTYAVIIGFSSNIKFITIVTSIFLVVVNLIPNFKYVFTYGFYDPLGHYGFINEMIRSGNVPEVGFYRDQYGSTPGLHIFVSVLSIATGLNGLVAMKIFLTVSPFIIPLAVYLVTRKLHMSNGLAKVTIASTAIAPPITYIYTGTTSVYFLFIFFIYFYSLFAASEKIERSEFIVSIFFGAAIVISHDVTSFFLLIYVLLALLFWIFRKVMKPFSSISVSPLLNLIFVTIFLAHFIFGSSFNFLRLLSLASESLFSLFVGKQPVAFSYYPGFYQLTLLDKGRILLVRFAKDTVSLFLIVLGFIAMLRLRLRDDKLKKFYHVLLLPLALAALVFFLPLFLRPLVPRGLHYAAVFFPFFAGLSLFYLFYSKHWRFNRAVLTIVMFSLVGVSFFQIYPFQPLIPKISTSDGNYYVVDWRQVNTAYERSLISFMNMHNLRMNITTDRIFRWQIYALANSTFQALLTWGSPTSMQDKHGPVILVSRSGASHIIPSGREAIANEQYLRGAIQENSVIYTNGEAYALLESKKAAAIRG